MDAFLYFLGISILVGVVFIGLFASVGFLSETYSGYKRKIPKKCECGNDEFTRWETKSRSYIRAANMNEMLDGNFREVEITEKWQERQCTICGKLYQIELDH